MGRGDELGMFGMPKERRGSVLEVSPCATLTPGAVFDSVLFLHDEGRKRFPTRNAILG